MQGSATRCGSRSAVTRHSAVSLAVTPNGTVSVGAGWGCCARLGGLLRPFGAVLCNEVKAMEEHDPFLGPVAVDVFSGQV